MNKNINHDILVKVTSNYEDSHSFPHLNKYVHSYHVTIINNSKLSVQLLSRYWVIVNGLGEQREVRGKGVIGKQPIILPGEFYEYSSWSPMNTVMGKMYGSYSMVRLSDSSMFVVKIPEFSLNANTVNN